MGAPRTLPERLPCRQPCIVGLGEAQGRVSHTGLVTAAALQGMSSPETKPEK